jgi:hypothetical protein
MEKLKKEIPFLAIVLIPFAYLIYIQKSRLNVKHGKWPSNKIAGVLSVLTLHR